MWREFLAAVMGHERKISFIWEKGAGRESGTGSGTGDGRRAGTGEAGGGRRGAGGGRTGGRGGSGKGTGRPGGPEVHIRLVSEVRPAPKLMR